MGPRRVRGLAWDPYFVCPLRHSRATRSPLDSEELTQGESLKSGKVRKEVRKSPPKSALVRGRFLRGSGGNFPSGPAEGGNIIAAVWFVERTAEQFPARFARVFLSIRPPIGPATWRAKECCCRSTGGHQIPIESPAISISRGLPASAMGLPLRGFHPPGTCHPSARPSLAPRACVLQAHACMRDRPRITFNCGNHA